MIIRLNKMSEDSGEFKKRLSPKNTLNQPIPHWVYNSIIEEAKQEIWQTFYRGDSSDTRKVLHKWFGKEAKKSEP